MGVAPKKPVRVYAHNFANFDSFFIIRYYLLCGLEKQLKQKARFIKTPAGYLAVSFGRYLRFQDSMKIIDTSLNKACSAILKNDSVFEKELGNIRFEKKKIDTSLFDIGPFSLMLENSVRCGGSPKNF